MLQCLSWTLSVPRSSQFSSVHFNCSLFGAHNVRGQISAHNFSPNGAYLLFTFFNSVINCYQILALFLGHFYLSFGFSKIVL